MREPTPARIVLRSDCGVEAALANVGASFMAVRAPDRAGVPGHVVLGLEAPDDYRGGHPHLGSTVGRVANRIAGARFALDGREVRLPANDGRHHLHGGPRGFSFRVWDADPFREPGVEGVRFSRTSPDGEEGYPGTVRVVAEVRLFSDGALRTDLRATTDRPTVVSLTQHPYFNLCDGGAGSMLGHELRVLADRYTPTDAEGIPSGELAPVAGTPLDFRAGAPLGAALGRLRDGRGGYDHNFALDGPTGRLRPVARLRDPVSGRVLTLETTLPGLQLCTGNGLDGSQVGRGGVPYRRHAGVCLEAQLFPDAPHHAAFPSAVLHPGATWSHAIVHRFAVEG